MKRRQKGSLIACRQNAIKEPTSEGGILREDVFGGRAEHDEDVNDATLRDPAYVCLRRLTGALHVIQHFPEHSLERERGKPTLWCQFVPKDFYTQIRLNFQPLNASVPRKRKCDGLKPFLLCWS